MIEEIINGLLGLSEKLLVSQSRLVKKGLYSLYIEGLARKSYWHLYAISNLMRDSKNGDALIDLSRAIFEFMIYAMYADKFGSEAMAKKFFFFIPIEKNADVKYVEKVEMELPAGVIKKQKVNFESVKGDYVWEEGSLQRTLKKTNRVYKELKKAGVLITNEQEEKVRMIMTEGLSDKEKLYKTPFGKDLEAMMNELERGSAFPVGLHEVFKMVYTFGNRKNHASTVDVDILLGDKERVRSNQNMNMTIGLASAALGHIHIMMSYAEVKKNKLLTKKLKIFEKCLLDGLEKGVKPASPLTANSDVIV